VIWDLLALAVQGVVNVFHFWMGFLPLSPLYLSSSDIAAVATAAGYAAFFLPVSIMTATLVLFLAGVLVWAGVLLVIQLVEAITP